MPYRSPHLTAVALRLRAWFLLLTLFVVGIRPGSAAPLTTLPTATIPFSSAEQTVRDAIRCPNQIANRPGGVVLLVHGTGGTGANSWAETPYIKILPNLDPGFDVCWIDLPDLAQGDIQMTGEFVAHAITLLALNSTATNGKLTVVSHSQGALDVQWALAFWPQTRGLVSAFVSLAGDFKGSLLATAGCKIVSLFNGGKGCTAATWQQATNSKFLQTLNNAAGLALVPTTSIRSLNDDVVVPQVGENASSVLPWASNVLLQDVKVCGPDQDVNHSEMRIDPGAFALAYEALYRASKAQGSRPFDQKYCKAYVSNNSGWTVMDAQRAIDQSMGNFRSFFDNTPVKSEPPIMPYAQAWAP